VTQKVDTDSRDLPGGGHEISSSDSEGNSYSVRSWSDGGGTDVNGRVNTSVG